MLRRRLVKQGFDVVVARDGAAGVAAAEVEKPDLILMDLSLPIMSGWEATRLLRASHASRHTPVIALSAHALEGERDKAIAAGCDDFEPKPVDLQSLLEKVNRLLGSTRS
jgi:two-component system cell cycle response regulator DivK